MATGTLDIAYIGRKYWSSNTVSKQRQFPDKGTSTLTHGVKGIETAAGTKRANEKRKHGLCSRSERCTTIVSPLLRTVSVVCVRVSCRDVSDCLTCRVLSGRRTYDKLYDKTEGRLRSIHQNTSLIDESPDDEPVRKSVSNKATKAVSKRSRPSSCRRVKESGLTKQ